MTTTDNRGGFLQRLDDDRGRKYAESTLRGLAGEVATAQPGTRNDTLNRAAFKAASKLIATGHMGEAAVTDALTDVARRAGLDDREITATIASGLRGGESIGAWSTAPQADQPPGDSPRLWPATELRPAAQQRWLAKHRLRRAAVNLLIGDEGIGKSLLWVWVAAAITTGQPLPEFGIPARDPGHVIVVATEDDWSSTVRPRLEVAGADLAMMAVICTDEDGGGAPVFPRDLPLITGADPAPALLVVDAWLDTVPANLRVRDPQDARQALSPWKDVAVATDAAILLLTHTNRVASANPRDKYGLTMQLRKLARLTLFAQQDDEGRLLVGPDKANTTGTVAASAFTIAAVQHFPASDDDDGTVPLLTHVGDTGRTAREHIAEAFEDDHADRQDRSAAERWLDDYLEINPGAKSADVKHEARKAGIAERTLQRARSSLGVVISYTGMPAVTTWTLRRHADLPHISWHNGTRGITAGQTPVPADESESP